VIAENTELLHADDVYVCVMPVDVADQLWEGLCGKGYLRANRQRTVGSYFAALEKETEIASVSANGIGYSHFCVSIFPLGAPRVSNGRGKLGTAVIIV
jgi:hypothetical protein